MNDAMADGRAWPKLDWGQWKETAETLHLWMQIVGKTRLGLTAVQNHWWNVPLYVTARGLSTSGMPVPEGGLLDIEFDLLEHALILRASSGKMERLALEPQTVADFYARYRATLKRMGVTVEIDPLPVELKEPIRFDLDTRHKSYDGEAAGRFWRVLWRADALLKQFSTNFYGKISPVHFFWGSFDLAVTRFNGPRAPARADADGIQAEAYSHVCISAGFWPGNGGYGEAAFYCYAAPVPEGLSETVLRGPGGFDRGLGEFVLKYEDVRRAREPEQTVLDFLGETYSAAADAAGWDRKSLDRRDAVGNAAERAR